MNNLSNSPAPGSGSLPAKEVTSTTRSSNGSITSSKWTITSSNWTITSSMLKTSIGSPVRIFNSGYSLNSFRTSMESRPSMESMDFEISQDMNEMLIGGTAVFDTSMKDANESQPLPCDKVSSRDILLGQGRHSHEGNMWFRNLIFEQSDKYNSLRKRGKTEFSTEIVQMIRDDGRRFYIREGNNWVEMNDDEKARKKVASHFRDEKKRRRENTERKANDTFISKLNWLRIET